MYRSVQAGNMTVIFVGFFLFTVMIFALCVDFAFAFGEQNQLQTAAEAAALAAAQELYTSNSTTPAARQSDAFQTASGMVNDNAYAPLQSSDVTYGYIDPSNPQYDASTFSNASSDSNWSYLGGYNAVRVTVRRLAGSTGGTFQTIFAQMAGVQSVGLAASAVALLDNQVSSVASGVRPIYGCKQQFDIANANGGDVTQHVIRIYGQQFYIDGNTNLSQCPPPGSGNWGFADLRPGDPNGAPGDGDLVPWWESGYSGSIYDNQFYGTQPGNELSDSGVKGAISTLELNKTVITIPLIDNQYSGSGSNVKAHVVGFAGFVITNAVTNGSANSRYVEGHFVKSTCTAICPGGGSLENDGIMRIRLASS